MNFKRLIPAVAVTAAFTLGVVPGASAATSNVQQAASQNWSGYVVGANGSGGTYSSVSGSWVQPTATCPAGSQTYSAFWVGLGGSGSGPSTSTSGSGAVPSASSGQTEALEQAGTEADCSANGAASYFAWYELVPAAPVRVSLAVHPGDHISSRVGVSGNTVTVQLSNQTTGQSTTRTLTMNNPDTSSAEWIAEAPSSCDQTGSCQPLPLTDFGTVTFTGASATAAGHTGTISDSNWSAAAVQLSAGAGGAGQFASDQGSSSAGATPSSLSSDGSSFSVAYAANAAQTSTGPSTGGSGDGGYGGYGGYGYGGYGSGFGAGTAATEAMAAAGTATRGAAATTATGRRLELPLTRRALELALHGGEDALALATRELVELHRSQHCVVGPREPVDDVVGLHGSVAVPRLGHSDLSSGPVLRSHLRHALDQRRLLGDVAGRIDLGSGERRRWSGRRGRRWSGRRGRRRLRRRHRRRRGFGRRGVLGAGRQWRGGCRARSGWRSGLRPRAGAPALMGTAVEVDIRPAGAAQSFGHRTDQPERAIGDLGGSVHGGAGQSGAEAEGEADERADHGVRTTHRKANQAV